MKYLYICILLLNYISIANAQSYSKIYDTLSTEASDIQTLKSSNFTYIIAIEEVYSGGNMNGDNLISVLKTNRTGELIFRKRFIPNNSTEHKYFTIKQCFLKDSLIYIIGSTEKNNSQITNLYFTVLDLNGNEKFSYYDTVINPAFVDAELFQNDLNILINDYRNILTPTYYFLKYNCISHSILIRSIIKSFPEYLNLFNNQIIDADVNADSAGNIRISLKKYNDQFQLISSKNKNLSFRTPTNRSFAPRIYKKIKLSQDEIVYTGQFQSEIDNPNILDTEFDNFAIRIDTNITVVEEYYFSKNDTFPNSVATQYTLITKHQNSLYILSKETHNSSSNKYRFALQKVTSGNREWIRYFKSDNNASLLTSFTKLLSIYNNKIVLSTTLPNYKIGIREYDLQGNLLLNVVDTLFNQSLVSTVNYDADGSISIYGVVYEPNKLDNDIFMKRLGTKLLGIKNYTKPNQLVLYPNPAFHTLYLKDDSIYDGCIAEIYSFEGKLVQSVSIENNSIDISKLQPSIYLLRFKNKSSVFVKLTN